MKKFWAYLLPLLLIGSLVGCSGGDRLEATPSPNEQLQTNTSANKLVEVGTPKVIQELRDRLDRYHPQVSILSPSDDRVFDDTTVEVKFQVEDLPIFKNSQLEAGNHLHVILDNEPVRSVYDLDEPLVLENLAAGTHTLRVFAVRPWDESFKNEGAFAQTTFHILTKTGDNIPNPQLPLLTYNSPSGVYGAEPIMLDFYLNNAPLHLVAKQDPDDNIKDWRIRVSVNGESFVLDNWQPVYLKGFQKGKNWVQIEYIDENGQNVPNTFNNTVRVITYDPKEKNTLAKLVKNELSLETAKGIIEPNYATPVTPTPETVIEEVPVEKTLIEEEIAPVLETETSTDTTSEVTPAEEAKESEKIENSADNSQESVKIEPQVEIETKQPIAPSVTSSPVTPPVIPDVIKTPVTKEVAPTTEPTFTIELKETENVTEEEAKIQEEESTIEPTIETTKETNTEAPKSFKLPQLKKPEWLNGDIFDRLKS